MGTLAISLGQDQRENKKKKGEDEEMRLKLERAIDFRLPFSAPICSGCPILSQMVPACPLTQAQKEAL